MSNNQDIMEVTETKGVIDMKKYLGGIVWLLVILLLVFFPIYDHFAEPSPSSADKGTYADGYLDGFNEGYAEAKEDAKNFVSNRLSDIDFALDDKYGFWAEDASTVLWLYLDGEEVSKADLENAMQAMVEYYEQTKNIENVINLAEP